MIDVRQIRSLSEFQRNAREFLKKLAIDRSPIVLTVNGKAEAVVLDPATFQALTDSAYLPHFEREIRKGIEDVRAGRTQDADEAFDEIEAELDA